jgi:hypothetical protein
MPSLRHAITTHSGNAPVEGREGSEILEVFDVEENDDWSPDAHDPTDWASPPAAESPPAASSHRLPRPSTSPTLAKVEATITPPNGQQPIGSEEAHPTAIDHDASSPLHVSSEPETRALVAELVEQVIAHAQIQTATGQAGHAANTAIGDDEAGKSASHALFRRGLIFATSTVAVVALGFLLMPGREVSPAKSAREHEGAALQSAAAQPLANPQQPSGGAAHSLEGSAELAAIVPNTGSPQAAPLPGDHVEPSSPLPGHDAHAAEAETANADAVDHGLNAGETPPQAAPTEVQEGAAVAADESPGEVQNQFGTASLKKTSGRTHRSSNRASSKSRSKTKEEPPPAAANPAPAAAPKPALAEHKRLLRDANNASGKAAYDLAAASHAIHPSDAALLRMTTAACQMKREDLARKAFRQLPMMSDGRKRARERCKANKIRLGVGF